MLRRYFTLQDLSNQSTITIDADLYHHICTVCREGLNSKFEFLSHGVAYTVQISNLAKRQATCEILSQRELPELPGPHVTLCLALPKFATFEAVLEKACELGVARVLPFTSEFSSIRKSSEVTEQKRRRWQKILEQSYQQSGRGRELKIAPVSTLPEILKQQAQTENCFALFAYEGETPTRVSVALRQFTRAHGQAWIFVGSEGGFSSAEVELFRGHGISPASLGPQILRVETACITLVSILKYESERIDERKF